MLFNSNTGINLTGIKGVLPLDYPLNEHMIDPLAKTYFKFSNKKLKEALKPTKNIAYLKSILHLNKNINAYLSNNSKMEIDTKLKSINKTDEEFYENFILTENFTKKKETLITQPKPMSPQRGRVESNKDIAYDFEKYYNQIEKLKKNQNEYPVSFRKTYCVGNLNLKNKNDIQSKYFRSSKRNMHSIKASVALTDTFSTFCAIENSKKKKLHNNSNINTSQSKLKYEKLNATKKFKCRLTKKNINNDFVKNMTSFDSNCQKAKSFDGNENAIKNQNILPICANQYKVPITLRKINKKLKEDVHILLNQSKDYKNENILDSYTLLDEVEKTKNSNYTQFILDKIRIVLNFLKSKKDKFKSVKAHYRKIFVIIDGTVVFNENYIQGIYIEIPTRRYLAFFETKKERMKRFYEFLGECKHLFRSQNNFKTVFLLNGFTIFDLFDIPETEKAIYISTSSIFRGVHLFNDKKIQCDKQRIEEELKILKYRPVEEEDKNQKHKKRSFFKLRKSKIKQNTQKKFKVKKKQSNYLLDQSFTFGVTDQDEKDDFVYFSENESKRTKISKALDIQFPTKLDKFMHLNNLEISLKISEVKDKNMLKVKHFLKTRNDESNSKGVEELIRNYNEKRRKKLKIKVNHQLSTDKKIEQRIIEHTTSMMKTFMQRLQIFKIYKDTNKDLDSKVFYLNEKSKPNNIILNILRTKNILYQSDYKTEKYYPDLISLNIPHILNSFPKLKRREFYEIFIQFKTLMKLCVCVNKNISLVQKGIDFNTFFNCNPQMKLQGESLARKIFSTVNALNSGFINWEEYMKGMLTMKSKEIDDKIDMFFKVIDTDGNGLLSFDEVYSLSVVSLQRSIGKKGKQDEKNEVISKLAEYFAHLIFQLVNMPIDQEIPLYLIKKKIIEGGSAAEYLEMFICADNFT